MQPYQERLARLLASSGALVFGRGLKLKDGRPTPYFVNLGRVCSGRGVVELGECMAEWMITTLGPGEVDVIVGPSYKASAIAQAMTAALWRNHQLELAYDYDRKEAKTHGEHTGAKGLFVTGAAAGGARVLIVDDVATSMATKYELLEKLRAVGVEDVVGLVVVVDREQTEAVYDSRGEVVLGAKGADPVKGFVEATGIPVWSVLSVRELVEFVAREGLEVVVEGRRVVAGQELVQQVKDYLEVYGR